jgi:hypothetical protein
MMCSKRLILGIGKLFLPKIIRCQPVQFLMAYSVQKEEELSGGTAFTVVRSARIMEPQTSNEENNQCVLDQRKQDRNGYKSD